MIREIKNKYVKALIAFKYLPHKVEMNANELKFNHLSEKDFFIKNIISHLEIKK